MLAWAGKFCEALGFRRRLSSDTIQNLIFRKAIMASKTLEEKNFQIAAVRFDPGLSFVCLHQSSLHWVIGAVWRDVTSPLHASICHPHASAEAYSRNYPLRFCISRDLEDMPNSPCSNVYTTCPTIMYPPPLLHLLSAEGCGNSPSRVPCTLGSIDIACLRALIVVHPACIQPRA